MTFLTRSDATYFIDVVSIPKPPLYTTVRVTAIITIRDKMTPIMIQATVGSIWKNWIKPFKKVYAVTKLAAA